MTSVSEELRYKIGNDYVKHFEIVDSSDLTNVLQTGVVCNKYSEGVEESSRIKKEIVQLFPQYKEGCFEIFIRMININNISQSDLLELENYIKTKKSVKECEKIIYKYYFKMTINGIPYRQLVRSYTYNLENVLEEFEGKFFKGHCEYDKSFDYRASIERWEL